MEGKVATFANRLLIAMNSNNINQVELSEKTNAFNNPISQSLINKYLKGKALARQNNLYILAKTLNVDEAWLMGYDVPMRSSLEKSNTTSLDNALLEIDGLDEKDIAEIKQFIEFLKNKKKNQK